MDEDLKGSIIVLLLFFIIISTICVTISHYHTKTIELEKYKIEIQTLGEPKNTNIGE